MPTSLQCSSCSAPLPVGVSDGLCSSCLEHRITTMKVEGGLEAVSFSDPSVANGANIFKLVQEILALPKQRFDHGPTTQAK